MPGMAGEHALQTASEALVEMGCYFLVDVYEVRDESEFVLDAH